MDTDHIIITAYNITPEGSEAKAVETNYRCPECGNYFVTANMWHSCGKYSLDDLFAKSEPQVLALYHRFAELVQESCGPIRIIPQKTRVSFQARVRFAGCVPRKRWLQCAFWFKRRVDHPRFFRIEHYGRYDYGHLTRVHSEDDFDEDFIDWIRESYIVGEQAHLDR